MTEILAVDIGYGFTKAVTPKTKAIIYSIVGPTEQIRFESDVVASNGHGITVKVDGRFFFVGEQAALQSASASQTLDVTRTGSTEQKALFYAVASELVRTTSKQVVVVSGLPVANFDERNKRSLRKMFEGDHQVLRQGKRARRFEVTNVYNHPAGSGGAVCPGARPVGTVGGWRPGWRARGYHRHRDVDHQLYPGRPAALRRDRQ